MLIERPRPPPHHIDLFGIAGDFGSHRHALPPPFSIVVGRALSTGTMDNFHPRNGLRPKKSRILDRPFAVQISSQVTTGGRCIAQQIAHSVQHAANDTGTLPLLRLAVEPQSPSGVYRSAAWLSKGPRYNLAGGDLRRSVAILDH